MKLLFLILTYFSFVYANIIIYKSNKSKLIVKNICGYNEISGKVVWNVTSYKVTDNKYRYRFYQNGQLKYSVVNNSSKPLEGNIERGIYAICRITNK